MRYYSSVAVDTTLTVAVNTSATTFQVASSTGWPVSFPFTAHIDLGTASEEIVEVTNASGTTWTVSRGIDGSSPISHSVGATVVHGVSARDFSETQTHMAASTGVHGVAGGSSVVGTTDTQTLTNKTLTSPTINGGSLNSAAITGSTFTNPSISNPTITGGGSWAGSPTIATPTIASFVNMQHNHSNAAGGGSTLTSPTIATPAITTPTITSGGSWAGSPTITSPTISGPTVTAPSIDNPTITSGGSWAGNPSFSGQPTISNFTNMNHTHQSAAQGGTLTTAAISGLSTTLTNLQQPPVCIVRQATSQNVNDTTDTAITWDAEDYDSHNIHSTSTNNSRVTIPAGWDGIWEVSAIVMWNLNASGIRQTRIFVNGNPRLMLDRQAITQTRVCQIGGCGFINVVAGDIVEISVQQDTGSVLSTNVTNAAFTSTAHFRFVRPA